MSKADIETVSGACPQKVVVPEAYDRGFLVDHERRVLYVCEKDLHGYTTKNQFVLITFLLLLKLILSLLTHLLCL